MILIDSYYYLDIDYDFNFLLSTIEDLRNKGFDVVDGVFDDSYERVVQKLQCPHSFNTWEEGEALFKSIIPHYKNILHNKFLYIPQPSYIATPYSKQLIYHINDNSVLFELSKEGSFKKLGQIAFVNTVIKNRHNCVIRKYDENIDWGYPMRFHNRNKKFVIFEYVYDWIDQSYL